MLLYTQKLETYIIKGVLPKLLLVPNKFQLKGSFRRKALYITDIDVVNEVYPTINSTNIYQKLLNHISNLPNDILLIYVICGVDNRFLFETGDDQEINEIMPLLDYKEQIEVNLIKTRYVVDADKRLFFLNRIFKTCQNIKWTIGEVINNHKTLRGNKDITFTDTIADSQSLILKYFIKLNNYPVGADVVIKYSNISFQETYQKKAEQNIQLANYLQEFYYLLFLMRYHFNRIDREMAQEIDDIVEKKYGLYKQMLVLIESYQKLYTSNHLDYETAKSVILIILNNLENMPDLNTDFPNLVKQINDKDPNIKIKQWYKLLEVLYDEIYNTVNKISKKPFFKYLSFVPREQKPLFFSEKEQI